MACILRETTCGAAFAMLPTRQAHCQMPGPQFHKSKCKGRGASENITSVPPLRTASNTASRWRSTPCDPGSAAFPTASCIAAASAPATATAALPGSASCALGGASSGPPAASRCSSCSTAAAAAPPTGAAPLLAAAMAAASSCMQPGGGRLYKTALFKKECKLYLSWHSKQAW